MSSIKCELSKKNKYWVERHRYYELKHFCLQYPVWKSMYDSIDGLEGHFKISIEDNKYSLSDYNPTSKFASQRISLYEKMDIIEQCCYKADPFIGQYLLKAVTKGLSYDTLKMRYDIPCCRDTYYDRYRKFFWLLNEAKK